MSEVPSGATNPDADSGSDWRAITSSVYPELDAEPIKHDALWPEVWNAKYSAYKVSFKDCIFNTPSLEMCYHSYKAGQ